MTTLEGNLQTLTHRSGDFFRRFNPEFFGSLSRATFDPETWQEAEAVVGSSQGRGTTWFIRHGQSVLTLKHYRRGGLISKVVKDKYVFTGWEMTRAIREYDLLVWMREQGLPVPAPAAAQAERKGLFYRADLITERIADARDLSDILKTRQDRETIAKIGQMIAAFHRKGIFHADLNIFNILIDKTGKVWLIDFDRGYRRGGSTWRWRNIRRLMLSFQKEIKRSNILWTDDDWQCLTEAYHLAFDT